MRTRPPENIVIGPLLGHFVSCTVRQADDGFTAAGQVATSESALSNGEQLPCFEIGPVASAALARAMLVSHVRWQLENAAGDFTQT